MQTPSTGYIGARAVRARYDGASDMRIWRWLHKPELGFPKPIYINRRRYWNVVELEAWERSRAAAA